MSNPTGKGGFKDHPENRSDGTWQAEDCIPYWMHFFLKMNVEDFRDFEDKVEAKDRTLAQSIAYARCHNARGDLAESKEVTDRTSGKSTESIDLTSGKKPLSFSTISEEERDEIKRDIMGQVIVKRSRKSDKHPSGGKTGKSE